MNRRELIAAAEELRKEIENDLADWEGRKRPWPRTKTMKRRESRLRKAGKLQPLRGGKE